MSSRRIILSTVVLAVVLSSAALGVENTSEDLQALPLASTVQGDANGDGVVNHSDIFYLINYLFTGGAAPVGPADVNGDALVNTADIFYLMKHLFTGGPGPVIVETVPPDPATVAPAVDPTTPTNVYDSTTFLYDGSSGIQTGVSPGTITLTRAAVLRGRVLAIDDSPISGVKITILGHSEFGRTFSRADGRFDLAVNGGGYLTIEYDKSGYLPVQRQLRVVPLDYTNARDVVMIALDSHVTAIDLAAANSIQVAQGSVMSDSDGSRQATMLFTPGTTAATSTGTTLTNLHVRATEYTVGPNGPKAMPGVLPPTSGYTYAMELSADEAPNQNVTFNQPVITYVDNFLNFPVGGIVPVGYYDRDKVAWVAAPNGKVIKILSISNGSADLDTNGDGVVDDASTLAALGVSDAERQKLATLYSAGKSLWRVALTHFTPWDHNWPVGPPADAQPPALPEPSTGEPPTQDDCMDYGSIIDCQNQSLGESVDIVGTPFRLHYSSARMAGAKNLFSIDIPLSGASLPSSVRHIELEISIAGREYKQTFPPALNQRYSFTWDGTDAYGRAVVGPQAANIRVGHSYGAVYMTPALLDRAFGVLSGVPMTGNGDRTTATEITLWQESRVLLGTLDGNKAGGWSLDAHHHYSPLSSRLYLGDGSVRDARRNGMMVVSTVAGNGDNTYSGDGGPALKAGLAQAQKFDFGPDGSIYIVEAMHRVRRVAPDGTITTVAGTGVGSFSGDGGFAKNATLWYPGSVAVASDGTLYIADGGNNRIRKVTPAGIISTVAGTGTSGFSGDGGPATQAALWAPGSIVIAPDGTLYWTESPNQRVRRLGTDGIISTVAGTVPGNGKGSYSGDGGPASQASLNKPNDLALGPDGSLYVADFGNNRIRRIGTNGIITTVAGTGVAAFSGDNGPATQAALLSVVSVAVAPDGTIYIADSDRIRCIGTDGIIITIAGGDVSGSIGDGGFPKVLYAASDLLFGADRSLYMRESYRIRRLIPPMSGISGSEIAIASLDATEVYAFTGTGGRHLRTRDALTGAVIHQFGYNSAGGLISITDGYGNVTSIERSGLGSPTAIVAPGGQRTTLTSDANGYITSITNPALETFQFTYDANGLMLTKTDPKGAVYKHTYDALGHLIKDEDPVGGYKALASSSSGSTRTVTVTTALNRSATYVSEDLVDGSRHRRNTDADGAQTDVTVKPDGTKTVTYPDGSTTTLTLKPDPQFGMQAPFIASMTRTLPGGQTETRTAYRSVSLSDPSNPATVVTISEGTTVNGGSSTRVYDVATRTLTETTAEGRTVVKVFDTHGRVVSLQVPGVAPITTVYDSLGRVTETHHGSQTWIYSYDTLNRLTGRTDAAGRKTTYAYDAADRIIRKILPSGATYQFSYDAAGNRTQVVLPSGAHHDFTYSAVDLESSYIPPGNPALARVYNLDRQLTRVTLPGGRNMDYAYDAAGRTLGIAYAEGSTAVQYLSDSSGRAASVTQTPSTGTAQQIVYGYNGSRIAAVTAAGAAAGQYTYGYDNNFLPIQATLAYGTTNLLTSIGWDRDGLLTRYGLFAFTLGGPEGSPTQISDGTGTMIYAYDTLGRLINRSMTVAGQAAYSSQLTFDVAGRITARNETVAGTTHTFAYTYDSDGQLLQVQRDGSSTETYAYDPNINRTSRTVGGGSAEAATYDSQDRLTQRGSAAYQFDSDGFLAQRGSDAFTYSARGHLISATIGGGVVSYGYDAAGRRVSRVDSNGTTRYLYGDPASHLITAAVNATGDLTVFYYDTAGYLIALDRGGARYYAATDQIGSPRVITSSTGAVVKTIEYDSFGNVLNDSNSAFGLPIGYGGGLVDPATGLLHFGRRDYDPAAGRWTSRDPVLFEGGQGNLYAFVGNDPVGHRDPMGLFCIGATSYDGIGGGGQLCITSQGVAVCAEVGFGLGGGIVVDNGGLPRTGTQVVFETGGGWGPARYGSSVSLDDTGCLKAVNKAQLGPLTWKGNKTASWKGGTPGIDLTKLANTKWEMGASVKLAAKVCMDAKW